MKVCYSSTIKLDLNKEWLRSKLIEAFENSLLNKSWSSIIGKKIYVDITYISRNKCSCYIEILNTYLRQEYTLKQFTKIIDEELNLYFK